MKRVILLLLTVLIVFSMAACGGSEEQPDTNTVAGAMLAQFNDEISKNADMTAQELADALLTNPKATFSGATMPVEEGLLTGFDNAEITGFDKGVMFSPMIGTIPFVGYVFQLKSDTDPDDFIKLLQDNANPRWNVCTEAEDTVVGSKENKVLFIMAPKSIEEE